MKIFIIIVVLLLTAELGFAEDITLTVGQTCYITQHWWSTEEEGIIVQIVGVDKYNRIWVKVKTRDGRIHNRYYDTEKHKINIASSSASTASSSGSISKTSISTEEFLILFPSDPPGQRCPACWYDEKLKQWVCGVIQPKPVKR